MILLSIVTGYFVNFVQIILCNKFCSLFLNCKKPDNDKVCLTAMIIAEINNFLSYIKMYSYIYSLLNILILILCQLYLRKDFMTCIENQEKDLSKKIQFHLKSPQKGMIITLVMLYSLILYAIDFFIMQSVAFFIGQDGLDFISNQSLLRICCEIFSKILLFIIIILLVSFMKVRQIISIRSMVCIFSISFVLLTSYYIFMKLPFVSKNVYTKIILLLYLILSLILVIGLFLITLIITDDYAQKNNCDLLKIQNRMILKSQQESEHLFSLWRKNIHDYKNNLIAIKQMLEDNRIEQVKDYIDGQCELMSSHLYYTKTGNTVIDALINVKDNIAEKQGINFIVNASIDKDCPIDDFDLAALIGNLLDNAIEASINQNDPYIELSIKTIGNILMLKVINKHIDSKISVQSVSSKKDQIYHGIGLQSVKNTVNKYNGKFDMVQEDTRVIVTVLLIA